ncbi:MAG: glycosyltransferase family 4 protein [Pleurocapsa minor GSE-CHR-MK-17-07R]|jgi:glycosyltransferase involved in cell wall biosynthesis|nr:glycosyltransferase family 4 protein [Pleurocapsa minor GSE-CHR-MK 17-07R]
MKILNLLFATWYTGLGGGETAQLSMAAALDPARFRVHLLTPRLGQMTERWEANGWPHHQVAFRGASAFFIPALWARFPAVARFEAVMRAQAIDAVYSDYHALPFALPAAHKLGLPVVWMCQGGWYRARPWQYGFFRQPDAGFAVSDFARRGFLGDPPFMPLDSLPVLPLSVNTERFHPGVEGRERVRAEFGIAPDAPVATLIARFQTVKGHEVFQAAARRIAQVMPEARFLVAGDSVHGVASDNAYRDKILADWQADPLLRDRLTYMGFRSDVEAIIAASDVIVCSSFFEGFGVAHCEAMACARPVVSTRKGGPSEIMREGETGFLVDVADDAAIAERVLTLFRQPELRARMGHAGRERVVANYSSAAVAARFAETIERLVSKA